jgi:hypothetical protein
MLADDQRRPTNIRTSSAIETSGRLTALKLFTNKGGRHKLRHQTVVEIRKPSAEMTTL